MELIYHHGKNFGDAINPIIFNHYIPQLLKQKDDYNLLGIGSIIGLKQNIPGLKIVFSSGYAANQEATYGVLPKINNMEWDVYCVRGPLTASALGLHSSKAIADRAILLPNVIPATNNTKKYKFGFIPHHKSLEMYSNWEELSNLCGMKFIDVTMNPLTVLNEILASEIVITEAMHGAIVADAYRVPWIPVKLYPYINEFKWQDWAQSLNIKSLTFNNFQSIHDDDFFRLIIKNKTKNLVPSSITYFVSKGIFNRRINHFTKIINQVKQQTPLLSDNNILKTRNEQLVSTLEKLKKSYAI